MPSNGLVIKCLVASFGWPRQLWVRFALLRHNLFVTFRGSKPRLVLSIQVSWLLTWSLTGVQVVLYGLV